MGHCALALLKHVRVSSLGLFSDSSIHVQFLYFVLAQHACSVLLCWFASGLSERHLFVFFCVFVAVFSSVIISLFDLCSGAMKAIEGIGGHEGRQLSLLLQRKPD